MQILLGKTAPNIVGYTTKTVNGGSFVLTPNFLDVGGTGTSIQSIKLLDPNDEGLRAPGEDNIQLLNEDSVAFRMFQWFDEDNSPTGEEGWFDSEDFGQLSDFVFTKGMSAVVYTVNPGVAVSLAGEVVTAGIDQILVGGSVCFGNITHANMWIGNIKLLDPNEEGIRAPGEDNIQLLNEDSVASRMFQWFDEDNSPTGEEGWFDSEDFGQLTDYEFAPGEGFVLYTVNAGVQLKMPGALDTLEAFEE